MTNITPELKEFIREHNAALNKLDRVIINFETCMDALVKAQTILEYSFDTLTHVIEEDSKEQNGKNKKRR